MDMTNQSSTGPAQQGVAATVVLIVGPEKATVPSPEDLARWRRLTPSTTWVFVRLIEGCRTSILESISAALNRRGLLAGQVILVGTGETGRRVFESVLDGALACAGFLAVDIGCKPVSHQVTTLHVAFRLVLARENSPAEDMFLDQLHCADIDQRVIALDPAAANRQQALASAAESFLLELVAMVVRQSGSGI